MGNVVQLHPEDFNAESDISAYFHCKKCMSELPYETSPRDYQRIQVGWILHGLQVWCNRHDINIVHINFEGQKHPAVPAGTSRIKNGEIWKHLL